MAANSKFGLCFVTKDFIARSSNLEFPQWSIRNKAFLCNPSSFFFVSGEQLSLIEDSAAEMESAVEPEEGQSQVFAANLHEMNKEDHETFGAAVDRRIS